MRTLSFAVILLAVTAVGVAFHRPTSGSAEAARTPDADVAAAALRQGDALLNTDPTRAAAFYRACLALEGAGGDPATFRAARQRLIALQPTPAAPEPPKGHVLTLAPKFEPAPAAVPVQAETPRVVSVGPDGVVYEEQP